MNDFSAEEIAQLLRELAENLDAKGVSFSVKLVGGAAIAFTGMERRMTRAVDASYEPVRDVEKPAAEVARQHGLENDWLNSRAKAFIPAKAEWVPIDLGALAVSAASEETLLAMKLCAGRLRDMRDISYCSKSSVLTTLP